MSTTTSDVIVIGAGFAGITAARELSSAGLTTTLLEARDRIGGRTWTRNGPLGVPLELGGAFVHWQQPHIWSEIVRYGIGVQPVPSVERAYWVGSRGVVSGDPVETYGLMAPTMDALAEHSMTAFPRPHEPFPLTDAARAGDAESIAEFLDRVDLSEDEKLFARSFLALAFSGTPENGAVSQMQRLIALSAGNWSIFLEAMSGYTLVEGMSALIEAMHADSRATTHLNTVVSHVTTTDDGVSVTTADGDVFSAKEVIVTIPLNILTSAITFDPPLSPVKVAASEAGQVSKGVKVWMRARGRVERFLGFAPLPHPLNMAGYEYDVEGDTILLGFGADADQLDVTSIEQVQAAMRLWQPDIEIIAVDAHDWTRDPYSGETWAMYGPHQLSTFGEEFLRPDGCVHIAGGDYSQAWAGHVDGAIESGRRAAHSIRERFRIAAA